MPDFQTKQFDKGQVIFREAAPGDVAYILKKGSIEISLQSHAKQVVLTTIKPVTVFGEMALLLDEHKRTATATALENSELIEISETTFDDYVKSSPPVISTVLLALADRLQKTNERAARVPDMLDAASEILNLLAINDKRELSYLQTLNAISSILVAENAEIEEMFAMMESFNLLELKLDTQGQKAIHIAEDIDFLDKATKMHKALRNYSQKES
jgi:CRP/FNR family cyclic AMP-dependent transcriptional regulator